jgi:hypothetical protein
MLLVRVRTRAFAICEGGSHDRVTAILVSFLHVPHGLTATHQDKVNADLLAFIKS